MYKRQASDGIIQNASRKGFFIKGFNRQDVLENYFIIACLDSYAASLALGRLTDEDLNRMDAIVKRLQISIDQQDYEQYHDCRLYTSRIRPYTASGTDVMMSSVSFW